MLYEVITLADIDGGSGEFLAGQFREYYLQLLESIVITSYSIHYTKLYEDQVQGDALGQSLRLP